MDEQTKAKVAWVNDAHSHLMLNLTSADMITLLGNLYDRAYMRGVIDEIKAQTAKYREQLVQMRGAL